MSGPFGSSQWMYSSGGFYPTELEQSLRFNDGDSAYLSRTPASAGNRKTWTWSGWVKRGNLSSLQLLFDASTSASSQYRFGFNANDTFTFYGYTGSNNLNLASSAVFRDASSWYHLVVVMDTTQTTSSDRTKVYINGEQLTSFTTSIYPALNHDTNINNTIAHSIGRRTYDSLYDFDGYLSEVNFIDGQALDPTSFGEFKSGVWVANSYAGTYGTNGFYLNFSDSANIGDDLSGNANDWTANNLVATDVLLDSPTNNFAVLNPLVSIDFGDNGNGVLSEGNLKCVWSGTLVNGTRFGSIGASSGKWYFEADWTDNSSGTAGFGFLDENYSDLNGRILLSSSGIRMCAVDMDNLLIWFGLDGVWTGDPDAGTGGTSILDLGVRFPYFRDNSKSTGNDWTAIANFGQDSSFAGNKTAQGNTDDNGVGDFYYSPPSGYLALCTANLPDPVIDPAQDDVPADYFNTVLYTGNLTTGHAITGVGFQPDWVWIKNRTDARDHILTDAVRGATIRLQSNTTDAEVTQTEDLQSFDTDGFTVGAQNRVNESGNGFVAWNWLAGNGTSSNTDGSITSTVSVNQKAGFSIVGWTGDGTSGATVGHGLGATPDVLIIKARNDTRDWGVYHSANTSAPETDYLRLSNTNATTDDSSVWNDTAPTSSVFSLGNGFLVNRLSYDYIAYCFAEVEGYSKFGSYTGNGSADGPMIWTGFRPAFIMTKRTDSTGSWEMYDAKRIGYNAANYYIYAQASNAEATDVPFDILSNGFKRRSTGGSANASGGTYIYMAFAETPFKYANAR